MSLSAAFTAEVSSHLSLSLCALFMWFLRSVSNTKPCINLLLSTYFFWVVDSFGKAAWICNVDLSRLETLKKEKSLVQSRSHHKTPEIPSSLIRYGSPSPSYTIISSSSNTISSCPNSHNLLLAVNLPFLWVCWRWLRDVIYKRVDKEFTKWFVRGELETLLTTDSFSADSEDTWYMLSGFVRKKQLGCIWLRTSCCLSNRKDKHNLNFEDKKCCSRTQHSSCEQAIKRSCKCFEMLGRAFFGSNGGEEWQLQVTNVKLHFC